MDKEFRKGVIWIGITVFLLILAISFIEDSIGQAIAIIIIMVFYFGGMILLNSEEKKASKKNMVKIMEKVGLLLIFFWLAIHISNPESQLLEVTGELCSFNFCVNLINFLFYSAITTLFFIGVLLYIVPEQCLKN